MCGERRIRRPRSTRDGRKRGAVEAAAAAWTVGAAAVSKTVSAWLTGLLTFTKSSISSPALAKALLNGGGAGGGGGEASWMRWVWLRGTGLVQRSKDWFALLVTVAAAARACSARARRVSLESKVRALRTATAASLVVTILTVTRVFLLRLTAVQLLMSRPTYSTPPTTVSRRGYE